MVPCLLPHWAAAADPQIPSRHGGVQTNYSRYLGGVLPMLVPNDAESELELAQPTTCVDASVLVLAASPGEGASDAIILSTGWPAAATRFGASLLLSLSVLLPCFLLPAATQVPS